MNLSLDQNGHEESKLKKIMPYMLSNSNRKADLKGYKHHIRTDRKGFRILDCSNESMKYIFLIETVGIDDKGRVAYLSAMVASPLDKSLDVFRLMQDNVKTLLVPAGSDPWKSEPKQIYFTYHAVNPKTGHYLYSFQE